MRISFKLIVITVIVLLGHHIGFARANIPVYVSVAPQKYFVQQIGKDLVDVHVMVSPGASPHTYEPKPRQMAELAKTKIYFAIGVTFEMAWLNKIAAANPKMIVVHTDRGIKKLAMPARFPGNAGDEQHANVAQPPGHQNKEAAAGEEHHEHSGLDPHIWLSPPLVKIQARAILTALQAVDPAHRGVYQANYHEFAARIDQLDYDLKTTFAGKTGLQFMVFHPAWGYFAHTYGLEQVCIEIEGKTPKPAQLKALIEHARMKNIKIIFAQPQFSAKNALLIAKEICGEVVFADPLAENWSANMRAVADKFKAALK